MTDAFVREFIKLFSDALSNLYDKESAIIASEVNERCMAAHLFAFMKYKWRRCPALASYHIDYEYNREGLDGASKKIYSKYCDEKEEKWHWIIPDLIIHTRGDVSGTRNLVVIEFKKWEIPPGHDIEKLSEMTKQDSDGSYKYKFGFHVILGQVIDQTKIELFINGEEEGSWMFSELSDMTESLIQKLGEEGLLLDKLR